MLFLFHPKSLCLAELLFKLVFAVFWNSTRYFIELALLVSIVNKNSFLVAYVVEYVYIAVCSCYGLINHTKSFHLMF